MLFAQVQADRALLAEIRAIRAIDNHSHIPPVAPVGDAAAVSDPVGVTAFPYPVRLRLDNPEWLRVWRELYGAKAAGMSVPHATSVLLQKRKLMREQGDAYPAKGLDRVSIETALVNMPALGAGQTGPRFRWVPSADSLLYPFGGTDPNPEVGAITRPATLEEYTNNVGRTVARWRGDGAVAIKIALAYARTLDFAEAGAGDAARIYAAHAASGKAPDAAEYKRLQDYLFRVLAREAGSAGLVMHIHTGIGADPWFQLSGANPLLLEAAVSDKSLRSTNFVLIHGGWPFDRQAGVMLIKPNVYADFSAQTFLRSARALSETLRAWLEWYPEKVLFGTDAYPEPGTPLFDWEEKLWLANETAREALAIALTGMMNDGQITRARALELARMVLRDNAVRLYGLAQTEPAR
ncbi:MAG TPA: amidohydrolase family protein [Thermoanaerobaculia bacterium]|nr:amidohydrolase family protein [Thermoanaerobaculia bacterium]